MSRRVQLALSLNHFSLAEFHYKNSLVGIRFRCHHCEYELHVKEFQGGRKGRCPKCEGKFRIPDNDSPCSLPIEEPVAVAATDGLEAKLPEPAISTAENSPASTEQYEPIDASENHPKTPAVSETAPPRPKAANGKSGIASASREAADRNTDPEDASQQTTIRALVENGDAKWYVRLDNGEQFGPADREQFTEWLREDRIPPNAILWCEGWPDWEPAAQVLADFFDSQAAREEAEPAAPPVPPPPPAPDVAPAQAEALSLSPSVASPAESETGVSRSQHTRLAKKQRQKRNYRIAVAILSVLSLVMVVALVLVLILRA